MLTKEELTEYRKLIGVRAYIFFAIKLELDNKLMKPDHCFDRENSQAFMDRWDLDDMKKFRDALLSLGDNGYLRQNVQLSLELDDQE